MGNTNRLQLRDAITAWLQSQEVDEDGLDALLILPEHLADVYDCIGPGEAASLVESHPSHLRKIFTRASEVLKRFSRGEHQLDSKYVLNCLRFITRLATLLLEHNAMPHVYDLLWGDSQLAVELTDTLMGLCFSSKFTIPVRDSDISLSELIWYKGLVKETDGVASGNYEDARIEVLRCILACCSETVYKSQGDLRTYRNPWLWLWTSKDLRHAKALFFSLLNSVLCYSPEGWFGHGHSAPHDLAQVCAHLLSILLDSEIPSIDMIQGSEVLKQAQKSLQRLHSVSEGPLSGSTHLSLVQVYAQMVRDLSDPLDFEFVARNVVRLLTSARSEPFLAEETLLLLWEFIDLNPKFEAFVAGEEYAGDVFKCVLFFLWTHYKDPQKVGIVQICSFILLHLSGGKRYVVREFCIALDEEYQKDLEIVVPNGVTTLSDLMIVFTHSFVTSNTDLLSLISCLVTILRNISPFVKTIGTLPSIHLMSLIKLFSSPKLLEADTLYLQLLSALLETIDNRVQYQWEVYAI